MDFIIKPQIVPLDEQSLICVIVFGENIRQFLFYHVSKLYNRPVTYWHPAQKNLYEY